MLRWKKYQLNFTQARNTSRNTLRQKPAYFIYGNRLSSGEMPIGECGLLPSLSYDSRPGYEAKLDELCEAVNKDKTLPDLIDWPSILCGFEMYERHCSSGSLHQLFPNSFSEEGAGIKINGLIWMNSPEIMLHEIDEKIKAGFTCLKLKIGAAGFQEELSLLKYIRKNFSKDDVQIRVDANGAFSAKDALYKLEKLAKYDLHSIEQPIAAGQWDEMGELCDSTPLPIALDEELIGLTNSSERKDMIKTIKPQAIILKPSLAGGFQACDEWIALAAEIDAIWWATSALESNIGLNAIAQYTASKKPVIPQGLGTGMLYNNNIPSPMEIRGEHLFYNQKGNWEIPF